MQDERLSSCPLRFKDPRRDAILEPEEVSAIVRLNELGWGARRIARELAISRNTVKGFLVEVVAGVETLKVMAVSRTLISSSTVCAGNFSGDATFSVERFAAWRAENWPHFRAGGIRFTNVLMQPMVPGA
jgi:hypothetical protein